MLRALRALGAAVVVGLAACHAAAPGPAAAEPERFAGYLMVHFTGEHPAGEQIYFAASTDGLHWSDLNGSQPVLVSTVGERGVRDPSIVRSPAGDRYWILATDLRIASGKGWDAAMHAGSTKLVVWESTDLVSWSAPRLVDVAGSIAGAGCAWAPEAIHDPARGDYLVYWTTISTVDGVGKPRVYASRTRDFRTFTPAAPYIDRPGEQPIIDTQILEVSGAAGGYRYVRASGDRQMTLEGSDSLLGRWTRLGDLSPLGLTGRQVEGPILFRFNDGERWGLYVDQYSSHRGYLPLVTTDPSNPGAYRVLAASEYDLGADRKRHGSILNLTAAELRRVRERWGGTGAASAASGADGGAARSAGTGDPGAVRP